MARLLSPRFSQNKRLQDAANNNPPLRLGSMGAAVQILQEALVFLGYKMPKSTKPNGTLDGVYGTETASTIATFQQKNNLVGDKVTGTLTLASLDSYFIAGRLPDPIPAPTPFPADDLKGTIAKINILLLFTDQSNSDYDKAHPWASPGRQYINALTFFNRYKISLNMVYQDVLLSAEEEKNLIEFDDPSMTANLGYIESRYGAATDRVLAIFVAPLDTLQNKKARPFAERRIITSTSRFASVLIQLDSFPRGMDLTRAIVWLLLGQKKSFTNDPNNILFSGGSVGPQQAKISNEQWDQIQKSPLFKKL